MRWIVTSQVFIGVGALFGLAYGTVDQFFTPVAKQTHVELADAQAALVVSDAIEGYRTAVLDQARLISSVAVSPEFEFTDVQEIDATKIAQVLDAAVHETGSAGFAALVVRDGEDVRVVATSKGANVPEGMLATLDFSSPVTAFSAGKGSFGWLNTVPVGLEKGSAVLIVQSVPPVNRAADWVRHLAPAGVAVRNAEGAFLASQFSEEIDAAMPSLLAGDTDILLNGRLYRVSYRLVRSLPGGSIEVLGFAPVNFTAANAMGERARLVLLGLGAAVLVLMLAILMVAPIPANSEASRPVPTVVASAPPRSQTVPAGPPAVAFSEAPVLPPAPVMPPPPAPALQTLPVASPPVLPPAASSPRRASESSRRMTPPPSPRRDPEPLGIAVPSPSPFDAIAMAARTPAPFEREESWPGTMNGPVSEKPPSRSVSAAGPTDLPAAPFGPSGYGVPADLPASSSSVRALSPLEKERGSSGATGHSSPGYTPSDLPASSSSETLLSVLASEAPPVAPVRARQPSQAPTDLPASSSSVASPAPRPVKVPASGAIALPGRSDEKPAPSASKGPISSAIEAIPLPGIHAEPPPAGPTNLTVLNAFDERHYQEVFNEFVGSKARLGEPVDAISFQGFSERLRSSERDLIDRTGCKAVRFQVLINDRTVSLRPQLVR
jgi:hypothetical protein